MQAVSSAAATLTQAAPSHDGTPPAAAAAAATSPPPEARVPELWHVWAPPWGERVVRVLVRVHAVPLLLACMRDALEGFVSYISPFGAAAQVEGGGGHCLNASALLASRVANRAMAEGAVHLPACAAARPRPPPR